MPGSTGNAPTSRAGRPPGSGTVILGDHPLPPHPFGEVLASKDGITAASKVPHRALTEKNGARAAAVTAFRKMVVQHHADPQALTRTEQHRGAMKRLGLAAEQARLSRFPPNPLTQKGNLAELALAEYVTSTSGVVLPVYRLRYNPNIDQSMKGDDVLAFDLDTDPVRIIVGEAKFRGAPSTAAVKEIVEALMRSHRAGIPVSLQFVADRLFEAGEAALATRVFDCARLFTLGQLRIDYVGLLPRDVSTAKRVDEATPGGLRRLAMISLGITNPDSLVAACYRALE